MWKQRRFFDHRNFIEKKAWKQRVFFDQWNYVEKSIYVISPSNSTWSARRVVHTTFIMYRKLNLLCNVYSTLKQLYIFNGVALMSLQRCILVLRSYKVNTVYLIYSVQKFISLITLILWKPVNSFAMQVKDLLL